MTESLQTILQALHDSEINGEFSWFFDVGWTAALGDPIRGFDAEGTFDSPREALIWLIDKAAELYPDSSFARRFVR